MVYFGRSPDDGPMYSQYLGNGHSFIDQRPSYGGPGSFWDQQRPQPGRECSSGASAHGTAPTPTDCSTSRSAHR